MDTPENCEKKRHWGIGTKPDSGICPLVNIQCKNLFVFHKYKEINTYAAVLKMKTAWINAECWLTKNCPHTVDANIVDVCK